MKDKNSSADLTELAKIILSEYNIIPQELKMIQNKKMKTVWKFLDNGEIFCLKRLKHPRERAVFSVNAQVYIYNKGGKVPEVIRNCQNHVFTEYEDQIFVMYRWVAGRDLNFNEPSDLCLGIEGLAKFHKISKGYQPPEEARVSYKIGKCCDQYESMRNKLIMWKEQSEIKASLSGYRAYLKVVDSMVEIANNAIEAVKSSSYDTLTQMDLHHNSLCHQDYGTGNALFAGNDVYVIDLDGVTYDLPVRDLRKIIGKHMDKIGEWNKDKMKMILECYEKNNELSLEEKEFLKVDLLYPHWFFGDVKNLFQKNKLVSDSEIERIASLEQSKLCVLKEFFK